MALITDPDAIFELVRRVIAESLAVPLDEIAAQSRLIDDLGADSLDFVDIVFMVDQELDVRMRDTELSFLTRLDFSSPEVMREGLLTAPVIERLRGFLPGLEEVEAADRISPAQLFSLITVQAICEVAMRRVRAEEAERVERANTNPKGAN